MISGIRLTFHHGIRDSFREFARCGAPTQIADPASDLNTESSSAFSRRNTLGHAGDPFALQL
jgi:hypothetical protein